MRVELQSLDCSRVFRRLGEEGVGGSRDELLSVVEVEGSALRCAGNDTPRVVGVGRSPSNVVESGSRLEMLGSAEA